MLLHAHQKPCTRSDKSQTHFDDIEENVGGHSIQDIESDYGKCHEVGNEQRIKRGSAQMAASAIKNHNDSEQEGSAIQS
jgi:hypothetical protein